MSWLLTLDCPVPWCPHRARAERGGAKAQVTVKYRCEAGHKFTMDRKVVDQLSELNQQQRVLTAVVSALKSGD